MRSRERPMPWPVACVTGIIAFVVLALLAMPIDQPPPLTWLSFLLLGFVAGAAANRRGLLASMLGGLVVTVGIVGLLVAVGKAATGRYYEFGVYAEHFGPLLVMGLVLPGAGGMVGQALRKWFVCKRGVVRRNSS